MTPTPVGVLPPDGSKKRWSYPAKPQTLASLARDIQTTANSNDLLERCSYWLIETTEFKA